MDQTYQRESAIFDAAMELPPGQRRAYLDQACGSDAALCQRMEALLGAGETRDVLLDSPADSIATRPAGAFHLLTEKAGDRIGRYKLLQQVGEGGCGVVYMAEQEEPVRRRVALKLIKQGMDTRSVITRFEAERQALALMDHPNIARVLDAGATETGRPYFVMELVRGMKITQYCDEQKLSTRQRLALFIQVCQAVQHAHQKGIIHRDLKPSNILVTVNDGMAVPKVIDFGIAKATSGQQLTDKTLFTAFEQFIGTPAYMSPEQAVLTSVDVDTRSDIYSLGVLLYELLTSKTPFDAQKLLAAGFDEIRRTIREQEPPRPSTRLSTMAGEEISTTAQRRGLEAPKLVNEVRGDLDWIVMKCLEKERARRYETANGLAMDIQRHLNNEPVVACPPGRLYRFRKMVRRHKAAVAASALVAASLLAGITFSTVSLLREREAQQRATEQAAIAKTVSDFVLEDLLAQADPLNQAIDGFQPNPNLTVRQALQRAASRIGDRFKNHPVEEAAVRNAVGDALRRVGEPVQAIPHLRRSIELYRTKLGPYHRDTLYAMHNLAGAYMAAGKLDEAQPLFEETLALTRTRLGPDDDDTVEVMSNLAWLYLQMEKVDKALPLYKEAVDRRTAKRGQHDPYTLGLMNNLGMGYRSAGRLDEATALFEQTLKLMKARLRPDHPYIQHAMMNLGACWRDAGKHEQALAVFNDAVKLKKTALGLSSPSTLESMNELAETFVTANKYADAEKVYREGLSRFRGPPPRSEIPVMGTMLHHLANVLLQLNRPEEARLFAQEAMAAYERHVDWPANERSHAAEVAISILKALGKTEEIRTIRLKHIELLRPAAERGDFQALNSLAWVLATCPDPELRDGAKAVEFAKKAVELTGGKQHACLDTLAAAYAETGEFENAVQVQTEAVNLVADGTDKRAYESRLKLYQSNLAYRAP